MNTVTVITADIISSRQADEQVTRLRSVLAEIDHPMLMAPFSLSRGDEIQGVCTSTLECPEIIRHLRFACRPLKLRIGIGLGNLTSGFGDRDPWKMNGSAFVRAREALDSLKKIRRARTALRSQDPHLDIIGSALLHLMDVLEERWTDQQWQAVHAYERLGTYESAGEFLGVAFQNVEKRCRAANWPAVKQAEEGITVLGRMLRQRWG